MHSDEYGWGRPGFIPGVAVLAAMLILSTYAYFRLPADTDLPMQVGVSGNLQNYQSKGWALFFAPALVIGSALVMDIVPFVPFSKSERPIVVWYALLAIMVFATCSWSLRHSDRSSDGFTAMRLRQ